VFEENGRREKTSKRENMKSGMNVLYRHVYFTVDGDTAGRSTKYDYSFGWEKGLESSVKIK